MNDQNQSIKSGPREVFLQLLSIITLYLSVSSLISLLFQYIDFKLLNPSYYPGNFAQTGLRFPMATLIVSFPIYFYTVRKYRAWTQENPSLSSLKAKAWLSYLTLFLASLFIIGDLGSVVYRFLGGEFSLSFLIKTAVLLVTCGLIFYYYQRELKQNWEQKQLLIFSSAIWVLVLATIAYGLFMTGAPFKPQLSSSPVSASPAPSTPLALNPTSFPTATGNADFNWEAMNGTTLPSNAYAVNPNLYACQAQLEANNYPGQYVNGACRLTYGGASFDIKKFVVLTQQNEAGQWLASRSTAGLRLNPIYGGFENGLPIAICRVNANGVMQLGKVVSGNICDVALSNQEVTFNAYEVLYPTS